MIRPPSLVGTPTAAATARAWADAPTSITMFPDRSTRAPMPGGITVVESYWLTIAGPRAGCRPSMRLGRSSASPPARGSPSIRNQASPSWRRAASADSSPASSSGVVSAGMRPMPRTRMLGISMSESSKRRVNSRSWMSWKSARTRSIQPSSIVPDADVHSQLVALAEVAAVDDPLDDDPVGGDPILVELPGRLLLELLEAPLQAGDVELRESLIRRRGVLVDHVGGDQPHRGRDPGIRRHDHVWRPDLDRDRHREQGACPALGDEGEVARVVALAHGVLLDRLHHRVRQDLDGAHGRLLDAHARAPVPARLRTPAGPGPGRVTCRRPESLRGAASRG